MADQPPNEVMGAFGREQADLAAAGVPAGIAAVGTVVADADLLDPHGAPTTLYAATGGRAAVLVFYRGAWCPYCNIALATYQAQLLPQLTERGITLVAVSPQAPDGSLTMAEKNELTFTVVSDPGNTIAGQLGDPHRTLRRGPRRAAPARPGPDHGQRRRHHHAADADRRDPRRRARAALDRCPPRLQHPHRSPADPRRPRPARPLSTTRPTHTPTHIRKAHP